MGLTTDPSAEERARGFVRPVRRAYRHTGAKPRGPLRPITPEEREKFHHLGENILYETYQPPRDFATGRYWTQGELQGCGVVTEISQALAETYARYPDFYRGTFCSHCQRHFPVGADGEFAWEPDGSRVGT